jgi:hypothetical protein
LEDEQQRRDKHNAVEPVHHSAMPGQYVAEILYVALTLDKRARQIAQYCGDGGKQRGN